MLLGIYLFFNRRHFPVISSRVYFSFSASSSMFTSRWNGGIFQGARGFSSNRYRWYRRNGRYDWGGEVQTEPRWLSIALPQQNKQDVKWYCASGGTDMWNVSVHQDTLESIIPPTSFFITLLAPFSEKCHLIPFQRLSEWKSSSFTGRRFKDPGVSVNSYDYIYVHAASVHFVALAECVWRLC